MIRNLIAAYVVLLSVSLFAIAAVLALKLLAGGLSSTVWDVVLYGMLFAFMLGCSLLAFFLYLMDDAA
jgi:hypothetical protein